MTYFTVISALIISYICYVNGQSTCTMTAEPPDPKTSCCGQHASAPSLDGTEAQLGDYPWLAIIEHFRGDKLKLLCSGTLISGRYVLTTAHCVAGTAIEAAGYIPTNVRLGEHDTVHDGVDCVDSDGGGRKCDEGITVIPIEEFIPHPDYDKEDDLRRNDIALLRLSRLAPYTDFIRPLCLPTIDHTKSPPTPFDLYSAGWTRALITSSTKKNPKTHVRLTYRSLQECQAKYNKSKIELWEGQVCTSGEVSKDTCKSESGRPLMYNNRHHYEMMGFLNFGDVHCASAIPDVHTKVFHYKDWIRSQIKP